jgi:hypothetical protein
LDSPERIRYGSCSLGVDRLSGKMENRQTYIVVCIVKGCMNNVGAQRRCVIAQPRESKKSLSVGADTGSVS